MEKNLNQLVTEFLTGQITDEDLEQLKKAVADNPRLMSKIEEIAYADDLTQQWDIYNKVDDKRAMQQLRARLFPKKSIRLWVPLGLVAAAVLLIAVATFSFFQKTANPSPQVAVSPAIKKAMQQSAQTGRQKATVQQMSLNDNMQKALSANEQQTIDHLSTEAKADLLAADRIVTLHDKEYWTRLSDGTLVHLHSNSRLIHPITFGDDRRDVILDGVAYFMVTKDNNRPFFVHTANGRVRVYGTEFFVDSHSTLARLFENSESRGHTAKSPTGMSVVLVKGSIGVTDLNGNGRMLEPGQKAEQMDANSVFCITNVDVASYEAWNTGNFKFSNYPLDKLMYIFTTWYDITVHYDTPDIAKIRFTGNIDKYSNLESALNAICDVTGLHVKRNGNKINFSK